MWRAVWILWAFIYFITDPGPAGGNKADGMFLSVNRLERSDTKTYTGGQHLTSTCPDC